MDDATHSAPMVSYAQHDEDVRLARCFPDASPGFYVDVGAWHPMLDSVTYHFYKRGWHGINVEPTPDAFALLARYRPRDINLACLVGDAPGTQTIHVTPGTGLSTTSAQYADRVQAAGLATTPRATPRRTLAEICAAHAPDTIHFLKVDVEGDEPAVLRGHDWTRWRPWVVVVEGTEPGLPTRTEGACRPLLEAVGYRHATFDGLNDFYVDAAHHDLAARLAGPITPFELEGRMRERALNDVHRGGPLGTWFAAHQRAATREALARELDFDVAAYLHALGLQAEARPDDGAVGRAYPLVLGRTADAASLATWRTIVGGEGLSAKAFLERLCASEEHLTLRLIADAYLTADR